ncbi:biogenesis of outer membrane [Rhodopirellula islandica]|uniref:Biogenesis of outer membrane n=1 Tax=Rhodopirellula islandica TaxID=595434 RepID=A0A0J1EPA5_RHOIS|nr:RHS repeat-associated core domain-containing protein [Rhodopirellula islandica]KLU07314.1 biogenesis of outer membrane [Rhodopirellula islandica]
MTRVSSDPDDDKTVTYTWDHRNRLISVTNKDNSGTVTQVVEHTYDVFDRRVSMSVDLDGAGPLPEQTTRYVYNGTDVLATSDESGSVTQRMLHGPAVDQILAIEDVASGGVLWALVDHLGSVRDVIDSDGTVENHLVYDAYGNVVSETDTDVDFLYGFTGRERDEASGLNYHRARYFDTSNGRWMSQDPIRFKAGDYNLYRYVGNEATRFNDPSGLIQASDDEMIGGQGPTPQEQSISVLEEVVVPDPKFFWDPGFKWKLPKQNIPGANGEQPPLGPVGGVEELEDWGKDILKENLVEPMKNAAKERADKVVESIKGIFVKPKRNENEQLGPVRPKARPRFSFPKLFEWDLKIRPKIHRGDGMSIQGGVELVPLLPQERRR